MYMSITNKLIILLFIIFGIQVLIPSVTEAFYFNPRIALVDSYQFITSIFLHGGLMHILFNAYALFLFGNILERKITSNTYLLIFLGAGIFGNLIYYFVVILSIAPPVPALGASGAIYGLMGTVGILFPDLMIFLFYFPMKMKYAIILWLVTEFLGTFNMTGIASAAHLGGLVFGIVIGLMLKNDLIPGLKLHLPGYTTNQNTQNIYSHHYSNRDIPGVERNYKLPWEYED